MTEARSTLNGMSYAAGRKTREIGIRMALGALPRNVLARVFKQAILIVAAALTACYIPARRSVPVDPMVSLRHE